MSAVVSPCLLECAKSKIQVLSNWEIATEDLESFAATIFCVGTVLYTGDGDCNIFQYQTSKKSIIIPSVLAAGIARSWSSDLLPAGPSGDRIPLGTKFQYPLQTGPKAHSAPCTVGTVSLPGVKRSGRGVGHPPTYSAEIAKVRAISLSPLCAFVACYGVTITYFAGTSRWYVISPKH